MQPYKYDMVHTYWTGNSIIRGSQVSRTAHSEQLPAPVFTAVTPSARGLRKPFNSSDASSTTFWNVCSPRDDVHDTRVQLFRDSMLGTCATHLSILSGDAIHARTL